MAIDFVDVGPDGVAEVTAFLDRTRALPQTVVYKRRSIELLAPRPGERVVELGCGTGEDAAALAQAVSPGGRVFALDVSEAMLGVARERAGDVPGLQFRCAPAHATGLPDAQVDAVRIDRLLHVVEDPAAVLAEVARVLRPGGRVVLCEPEWSSLAINGAVDDLSARVFPVEPIGPPVFQSAVRRAGLRVTRVERYRLELRDLDESRAILPLDETLDQAVTDGVLSDVQAMTWEFAQAGASDAGRLLVSLDGTLLVAQR